MQTGIFLSQIICPSYKKRTRLPSGSKEREKYEKLLIELYALFTFLMPFSAFLIPFFGDADASPFEKFLEKKYEKNHLNAWLMLRPADSLLKGDTPVSPCQRK